MVPELGHILLIVLAFATLLGTVGLYGAPAGKVNVTKLTTPLCYGMFICALASIIILGYGFGTVKK